MRSELENIKRIEEYLNGQLSANETAAFKKDMADDPKLAEEVRLQQQIMQGIQRVAILHSIQQAAFKFKWRQRFYKGGPIGLFIVAAIVAIFHYAGHKVAYSYKTLPEYNEQGDKRWAHADSCLTAQSFSIDVSKDTVIETEGSIVLSIPANCFLTVNGQPATGKIDLAVKEALTPGAIIKAGLSTRSGNDLLETGGMFFIDARQNGSALKIDPKHNIYGQIPTDSAKAGMQLFHGERLENGTIDWVKPKPINHDLIPVDINSLDFYPPHYLDSLARWGYDISNKKLTDSLYYSLASFFATADRMEVDSAKGADPYPASANGALGSISKVRKDTSFAITEQKFDPNDPLGGLDCAINPAKIKAIWNRKFQNTIISTHEFQERLVEIHKSMGPKELALYVDNIDKPLYTIDSIVAKMQGPESIFGHFAARHDGKVNVSSKQAQKLRDYYRVKTLAFTMAATKTRAKFLKEQHALDNIANKRQRTHDADSDARRNDNFNKEFDVNLKEACRQLGYPEANFNKPAKNTYNVQITTTGWCNVDRYVYESVLNRASLNFSDKQTGKTANIKYTPVKIQISQPNNFDRLYVYLLPNKLNSFMLVNYSNGIYTEQLDALMKYNLVCIGYKSEQVFVYTENDILPKKNTGITLVPATDNELNAALTNTSTIYQLKNLKNEVDYQKFDASNQKRQEKFKRSQDLIWELVKLIFPCSVTVYNLPAGQSAVPTPLKNREEHILFFIHMHPKTPFVTKAYPFPKNVYFN